MHRFLPVFVSLFFTAFTVHVLYCVSFHSLVFQMPCVSVSSRFVMRLFPSLVFPCHALAFRFLSSCVFRFIDYCSLSGESLHQILLCHARSLHRCLCAKKKKKITAPSKKKIHCTVIAVKKSLIFFSFPTFLCHFLQAVKR